MFRRLRNALRALLAHDLDLGAIGARLEALEARLGALEAAHQDVAGRVADALDDRVDELDRLYAKVRSALGRLYRLKGWEDAENGTQEVTEGTKPKLADVLSAKFKR